MEILHNLCLHFARQDGKKTKENPATKVTTIPKTKKKKYWMNKTTLELFGHLHFTKNQASGR